MLTDAARKESFDSLESHLVSFLEPKSFEAEQYRRLRQRVEDLAATRPLNVIAVTSPVASDGKTLTSINLAGAFSRAGAARILLIDADLRMPTVARNLNLSKSASGWPELIETRGAKLEDHIQPFGEGLHVLTGGNSRQDTYELLRSPRVAELLAEARRQYDYVILDTPPLLLVPDSGLLSNLVDGYIVVIGANSTPRKLVAEALNLLEPASVIGLVFNRDRRPLHGYYRGYYHQYFRSYIRSAGA
jgi:capsular exopolysaccharide synthesis family protein